uniref:Uncharacterized protein n=1 Tax=Tetranychus urticae TaxID=32264 RepID=T1L590_TETUR
MCRSRTLCAREWIAEDFKTFLNTTDEALNQCAPRAELQAMMDAYIDGIEMVRMCEIPLGRAKRVDMKIFDRLRSFNHLRNYHFDTEDSFNAREDLVSQQTMDQVLWRYKFLLDQFISTFSVY